MNEEEKRELIRQAREAVADQVQITVNGKIGSMSEKLDDHIIKHDKAWEEMKPVLQAFRNLTGFRSTIVVVSIVITAIGGIIFTTNQIIGLIT